MSIRYLRMLERIGMSEEETAIKSIYDIAVQYAPECDPELVLQEMDKW